MRSGTAPAKALYGGLGQMMARTEKLNYSVYLVLELISWFLARAFCSIFGHRALLLSGDFESLVMSQAIENGNTVLELGAMVGQHVMWMSKSAGKSGRVFAFEPNPKNFRLLQLRVRVSSLRNVTLVRMAVSNHSGKTILYLSDENPGDHRIYDSSDNREYIETEAVRIDEFFQDYEQRIGFVAMDIQGAEHLALEGMVSLIKGSEMKIVSEFWPFGLSKSGCDPGQFLNSLTRLGFALYNVNSDERVLERVEDPSSLLERYTVEKRNWTNVLCIKRQEFQ